MRALHVCVLCVSDEELQIGGKRTLEQRCAFRVSEDPHAEKVSLQNQKDKVSALNSFLLISAAATAAKSLQSCLILCDPIDGSPPGPTVPGILQARTLEWVAISFSNA